MVCLKIHWRPADKNVQNGPCVRETIACRPAAPTYSSRAHGLGDLGHELLVIPILLQRTHAVLLDVFKYRLELWIVLQVVQFPRLPQLCSLRLERRVVHGHVLQAAAHEVVGRLLRRPQIVRLDRELVARVHEAHDEPPRPLQGLSLLCRGWHNHGLLTVQLRLRLQAIDDNLIARLEGARCPRHRAARHATRPRRLKAEGLRATRCLRELSQDALVLLVLLHRLHAILFHVLEEGLHLWVLLELLHATLDLLLPHLQSFFLLRISHDLIDVFLDLLHLLWVLHHLRQRSGVAVVDRSVPCRDHPVAACCVQALPATQRKGTR
mmetsp:Transcript_75337/g.189525  ORF Transcript_75337/g.189525 Transcript_75337/m.189525 type:complete len:323 (+) Transcript_75337:222-1190(+)